MTQLAIAISHSRDCVGCAGNGACWVCLGTGRLVDPRDRASGCHRCGSTGLCSEASGLTAVPDQPTGR